MTNHVTSWNATCPGGSPLSASTAQNKTRIACPEKPTGTANLAAEGVCWGADLHVGSDEKGEILKRGAAFVLARPRSPPAVRVHNHLRRPIVVRSLPWNEAALSRHQPVRLRFPDCGSEFWAIASVVGSGLAGIFVFVG